MTLFKHKMAIVGLAVLTYGGIVTPYATSQSLNDLFGGASISVGGTTLDNWRLDQDLGTSSPDFSLINVLPSAGPGSIALDFVANGTLAVSGDDSQIISFSYDVSADPTISRSDLSIGSTTTLTPGDGLVDVFQEIVSTAGVSVGDANVTLDPSFGVTQLTDFVVFSPQSEFSVSTSISVFGDTGGSTSSLGRFTQTINTVPEPSGWPGLAFLALGWLTGFRRSLA